MAHDVELDITINSSPFGMTEYLTFFAVGDIQKLLSI